MLLIIDNTADQPHATYLPQLLACIRHAGHTYRLVRTIEDMHQVPVAHIEGVILSGSPVVVENAEFISHTSLFMTNVHAMMRHHCRQIPILGICFGCQLLTVVWGGTLGRFRRTICRPVQVEFKMASWLGKRVPTDVSAKTQQFCCRYYPKQVPPSFRALATASMEGHTVPCMMRHQSLPIYGCLFHPEHQEDTQWVLHAFLSDCSRRMLTKVHA